jgi:MtrB/PioB family decaheme-associated outer membrane protein
MKLKPILAATVLGFSFTLITINNGFSQDMAVEGKLEAGGVLHSTDGSKAKAYEYSDTKSGVYTEADIQGDSPDFFVRGQASDIGYGTQHYRFEGGAYGAYKGWVDYNEITHNITNDAKSFYTGVGSGVLTGTPGTDSNAWSGFDYATKRKQFNAGVDLKLLNPFFFNVDYSNETKEGVKRTGTQGRFTGTNYFVELPEPVDYRSNTVNVQGGYASNPLNLSVSYLYSDFSNRIHDLNFTTDTAVGRGGPDFSLSPESRMDRIALNASIKLPMSSRFSANVSDARTKSDTSSFATFDGKIDTRNYDFILTSNPLRSLDAKVYYKYYDRDNKSSSGRINNLFDTSSLPETFMTEPISYTKRTVGGELGYRFPAKIYLTAGYKNVKTQRKHVEVDPGSIDPGNVLPYNTDHIYAAHLKWSGLDFMTAEIAYERLSRDADYQTVESSALEFRNFSYAKQDRDTYKAAIDLFPTDNLNLSLEYAYMKSTYKALTYGITGDTRNYFGLSADYALRKLARFSLYFDAEKTKLDEAAAYSNSTWESTLEENTYGCGVKADLYAIPKKLTLTLQGDYTKNSGKNDLTFNGPDFLSAFSLVAGQENLPVNVPNVDSYQRYSFRFVTAYKWSDAWTLRAGYIYDRYSYQDDQLDGYRYIVPLPSSAITGYLSGANASPDYTVNTIFASLTYHFKSVGDR